MAEWIQIFATTVAKMSHKGLEMGNPAQILDEKPFLLIFRHFFLQVLHVFLYPVGPRLGAVPARDPRRG